jgi:hypothetical protein
MSFPSRFPKVERSHSRWIIHKTDDREFPFLDGFDFQSCFVPTGSVKVGPRDGFLCLTGSNDHGRGKARSAGLAAVWGPIHEPVTEAED